MESRNRFGISQVTGMQTQVRSLAEGKTRMLSPMLMNDMISNLRHYSLVCVTGYHTQDEIDMFAINQTLFHWGLAAWCGYVVVGLACGLAAYRFGLPLTFRSGLYTVFRYAQSVSVYYYCICYLHWCLLIFALLVSCHTYVRVEIIRGVGLETCAMELPSS